MPTSCPKCLKDDQIVKVSAIYSSGRTDVYPSVLTDSVQTELSKTLAPPPEPRLKSYGSWSVALVLAIVACLLFPSMSGTRGDTALFTSCGIFLIAVLIAVGVTRRMEKKKIEEYDRSLLTWQKQKKKWEELYYCQRDDCVFDPFTGKSVPRHSMNTLLE